MSIIYVACRCWFGAASVSLSVFFTIKCIIPTIYCMQPFKHMHILLLTKLIIPKLAQEKLDFGIHIACRGVLGPPQILGPPSASNHLASINVPTDNCYQPLHIFYL